MRLFHRQEKTAPTRRTTPSTGVADVVERHPGLAMVVAADGKVTSASEGLRPFIADGPTGKWWDRLFGWLSRPNDDDGPVQAFAMDTGDGPAMVEWTAVALPDNTVALFGRDVTMDINLRDALAESRQRFRDLVDISSDFAWETGTEGRFVYVSPEGALGYAAETLVGQDPDDLLKDGDAVTRSPFQARRAVNRAELWLRRSDGEDACVVAWARPLFDDDGEWRGTRGLCREVTEIRQREAALARARTREQLLEHIMRTMRDEVEPDRMLASAAAAIAKAVGADGCRLYRQDIEGRLVRAAEHGTMGSEFDAAKFLARRGNSVKARTVCKDQRGLAIAARSHDGADGAVVVWRADGRDSWSDEDRQLIEAVGDQIGVAYLHTAYLERLKSQAERDGMTKLLNRRAMIERLGARLAAPDAGGGALLYIDIDNFKAVNDVHGHQRGDAVLSEVTALLRETTGPDDLRGRIGGDEFVVWLDAAGADRAEAVACAMAERGRDLVAHSSAPNRPVGLSVGVAIRPGGSAEDIEAVIERADKAMYRAKAAGRKTTAGGGWAVAAEGCES